jgi:hypothetical protein
MRASTLMLVAAVLYVVHRWASNEKAVDGKIIVEAAFAVLVIAMLDQGRTEPVATGFAWLFLIGAAYTAIPSIAKAAGTTTAAKTSTTAPQGVIIA